VTYQERPGEIRQTTANLEEISTNCALVLLEKKPKLGCAIRLQIPGRDLFGVIQSSEPDMILGWFVEVALDAGSLWRPEWFSPQHLIDIGASSRKAARRTKVPTLESSKITEKTAPVNLSSLYRRSPMPSASVAGSP